MFGFRERKIWRVWVREMRCLFPIDPIPPCGVGYGWIEAPSAGAESSSATPRAHGPCVLPIIPTGEEEPHEEI